MIYANKREEIAEFLQKAACDAWLMNKGSRMTSGKTDIEKGMASPTKRQNRKSTAGSGRYTPKEIPLLYKREGDDGC